MAGATITKTVFTVTVLHRTDDSDRLAGELNFENAWAESYDGNAVGLVTGSESTILETSAVPDELVALGSDSGFFAPDLDQED